MSSLNTRDKLYIITHSEMSKGLQTAQIVHATVEWCMKHYSLTKEWMDISNYVCVLQVPLEKDLKELLYKANELKIKTAYFLEPDLNNSLTAIILQPGTVSKYLTKNLELLC